MKCEDVGFQILKLKKMKWKEVSFKHSYIENDEM